MSDLEKLKQDVISCTKCSLSETRNKAVFGNGNPNAKISQIRGQRIDWKNRLVIPTYHPSALLRNPQLKRPVWEDFKQIVAKYRELVDPDHYTAYC